MTGWILARATFGGEAAFADAPRVEEIRLELAVPSAAGGFDVVSVAMLAMDEPGVDMEARAEEGRAAMLARFPGAIELPPGAAVAQYRIFGIRWAQAGTAWRYNPAGAPGRFSGEGAQAAVIAGADGWRNAGGSAWQFTHAGTTAAPVGCNGVPAAVPRDGLNVVGWGSIATGFLGYSCWWRSSGLVPGTPYFEATEFDIVLDPDYPHSAISLQALALHEFGHALGLDHTEDALCPGSAMCDGGDALTYPKPQADDLAGLVSVYGLAPAQPGPAPPGVRPYRLALLAVARD